MNSYPTLSQSAVYRICFAGRVKNGWSDFMSELQQTSWQDGSSSVTELIGIVSDQPALFGLLCHIRDLGLPLISVEFLPKGQSEKK